MLQQSSVTSYFADGQLPVRVIGLLIGVPLEGQRELHEMSSVYMRRKPGQLTFDQDARLRMRALFAELIQARKKAPGNKRQSQPRSG